MNQSLDNGMDHLKKRWTRMEEYVQFGMYVLFIGSVLLIAKKRLADAFTLENFPVAQLSILLLFETLVLIIYWKKASSGELEMFRDYFKEFVPPIPTSYSLIAFGISLFLVVLAYFSYDVVIYSSIFASFKLFESWGGWIRTSEIRAGLKRARNEASHTDERRKGWDIIENYEFEEPHVLRTVTVLFFSFVPLILGLLGELIFQTWKIWLLSAAYIVIILNIGIAEIVIRSWRRKRDNALGKPYVKLTVEDFEKVM